MQTTQNITHSPHWQQFEKLRMAARVRSEALENVAAAQKKQRGAALHSQALKSTSAHLQFTSGYKPNAPAKPAHMLGAQFDAYA